MTHKPPPSYHTMVGQGSVASPLPTIVHTAHPLTPNCPVRYVAHCSLRTPLPLPLGSGSGSGSGTLHIPLHSLQVTSLVAQSLDLPPTAARWLHQKLVAGAGVTGQAGPAVLLPPSQRVYDLPQALVVEDVQEGDEGEVGRAVCVCMCACVCM